MVADTVDGYEVGEETHRSAAQSCLSMGAVVEQVDAFHKLHATRLYLSTNPSLCNASRKLRHLLVDNSASCVTARVASLHAMFESLTASTAADIANLLREFPYLANALTHCVLKAAGKPTSDDLLVLLVQESSLPRAPEALPSPPVTHVSVSCFKLNSTVPTSRCRGLCTAISKSIERQRDWIWGLPVIRVIVLSVTRHDHIHIGKAMKLGHDQRKALLHDMHDHETISRWLNGATLGPLAPSDPAQYIWIFSFRKDLHVHAEKEMRRILDTQLVEVTTVVDSYISVVS